MHVRKVALLALFLAVLPLGGCVAPSGPNAIVSEGFPAGGVTIPEPWVKSLGPLDYPGSFWVQGEGQEWRANGTRGEWMQFDNPAFGTIFLARLDLGRHKVGLAYNITLAHTSCVALVTIGNHTRLEHDSFRGILTPEEATVKIQARAPCKADFTMTNGRR